MQRDLVVRAQGGDADAFSILASQAIDRLHGVAYRILRDADRADDATQEAMIAAWDHLPSLRDPERFDAWTYRLVVNAAYKQARHERAERGRVRLLAMAGSRDGDQISGIADHDELEQAFRSLSPEHRAVLVLHYFVDLPLTEIADIVCVPVGTVGSRLYHAARKLRAAMERDGAAVAARGHAS